MDTDIWQAVLVLKATMFVFVISLCCLFSYTFLNKPCHRIWKRKHNLSVEFIWVASRERRARPYWAKRKAMTAVGTNLTSTYNLQLFHPVLLSVPSNEEHSLPLLAAGFLVEAWSTSCDISQGRCLCSRQITATKPQLSNLSCCSPS